MRWICGNCKIIVESKCVWDRFVTPIESPHVHNDRLVRVSSAIRKSSNIMRLRIVVQNEPGCINNMKNIIHAISENDTIIDELACDSHQFEIITEENVIEAKCELGIHNHPATKLSLLKHN